MARQVAHRAQSDFDRMLDYEVRHTAWIIFRSIYWAIYLLLLGTILLFYSIRQIDISTTLFFGYAFTIAAIMLMIYGFAEVLHHKLMRKYA